MLPQKQKGEVSHSDIILNLCPLLYTVLVCNINIRASPMIENNDHMTIPDTIIAVMILSDMEVGKGPEIKVGVGIVGTTTR